MLTKIARSLSIKAYLDSGPRDDIVRSILLGKYFLVESSSDYINILTCVAQQKKHEKFSMRPQNGVWFHELGEIH